jgi:hypothetical protein
MIKIIQRREIIETVTYSLFFELRGKEGAGYAFDCDKAGNIDMGKLHANALANLGACQDGTFNVFAGYVQEFRHSYRQPAIGECDCGEHVQLYGFTNTCDNCEADYNMSGQRLAPREQWGEETGESLADILSI